MVMTALPDPTEWTAEQYLAYEREAATRHEFFGGEVRAMAGASERHNQIAAALNYLFYGQFLKRDCQVFQSDMRVQAAGSFFYPDLVIVYGDAVYTHDGQDTLTNPAVIIEILSPSTEDVDRGRKFAAYRQIDSLQDYLLVAQSAMKIEHFTRRADGWFLRDYTVAEDDIALPSVRCTLNVAAAYHKVTFD